MARVRNTVLVFSALAWMLLLVEPGGTKMHVHDGNPPSATTLRAAMNYLLMVLAMMLPALIPHIHFLRARSFRSRRTRSTALFLAGYTAIWMGIGCLLLAVAAGARLAAPHSLWPAAVAGLLALVWQCSPAKQRCLNRCQSHSAPAAFGFAADRAALRFGAGHGLWCAGSCWAWMLFPMLLAQGHMAAMVVVTILIFSERLDPPATPRWAWRGLGRMLRLTRARMRQRRCLFRRHLVSLVVPATIRTRNL